MSPPGHEPPRSARYGDTYYSLEDGWAEANHVFVDGNRLRERFAALGRGDVFTLAELGYGTGLNVAAALTAFAGRGHDRGHLAVFSVEGHPLDPASFAAHARAAARRWPAAAPALAALIEAYAAPVGGTTCRRLGGDATLTLGIGEAASVLAGAQLRADAWFLDGFSPALNPAMWSVSVLGAVARLSKASATAATFTVAGAVRRGLSAAGFEVAKAPGFGRKREMLTARKIAPAVPPPATALGHEALLEAPPGGPVAVLGAGIAGASLAWHLRRMGAGVSLYDPSGAAAGASGNPIGLVTPRVEAAETPAARFYRDAFAYAASFYAAAAAGCVLGEGCRILTPRGRADKVLGLGLWPDGALCADDGGLFARGALTIRPREAVAEILRGSPVVAATPTFRRERDAWIVEAGGEERGFASVVVANPQTAAAMPLSWDTLLEGSRGQIDLFAATTAQAITGDGYVAPLCPPFGEGLAAGATYAPAPFGPARTTTPDSVANAETVRRLTGAAPGPSVEARAAVRAATPDRHPLAGPVADLAALLVSHDGLRTGRPPRSEPALARGLFVLSGLGSRGLVTAPLLGAHLATLILGAPCPLAREASDLVSPARFAVRATRRRTGSGEVRDVGVRNGSGPS